MNPEHDKFMRREQGRLETRRVFIETRIRKVAEIGKAYHNIKPEDRKDRTTKDYFDVIEEAARDQLNATYDHAYGRGVQDTGQALRVWNRLFSYVKHALKNPHQSPSYLWEFVVRTVREISALRVMDHIEEQGPDA